MVIDENYREYKLKADKINWNLIGRVALLILGCLCLITGIFFWDLDYAWQLGIPSSPIGNVIYIFLGILFLIISLRKENKDDD